MNKILENYECDGQLNIFDLLQPEEPKQEEAKPEPPKPEPPKCFADYVGRCEFCMWGKNEKTCHWSINCENKRDSYRECGNDHNFWRPNTLKIPRLCGNCEYANQFCYEIKPEYKADAEAHNGYSHRGACDPVENNRLYCTRRENHEDGGAVNRSHPFADMEDRGFGIGYWHRQYEWATCDAWKIDAYWRKELQEGTK